MNAPDRLDPLDRYAPLFGEPDLEIASLRRRRSQMRRRGAIVSGVTATATVAAVVGVLTLAAPSGTRRTELAAGDAQAATNEPAGVASTLPPDRDAPSTVPVLVTACTAIDDVAEGSVELVPIDGGALTRGRGTVLQGTIDSSDPRLVGTLTWVIDEDAYVGPTDDFIAQIHAVSGRIDNADGSWQGSNIGLNSPDFESAGPEGPYVLTGRGGYEGYTAVLVETPGPASCWVNLTGMIIAGDFLEPPAPPTGG